MSTTTEGAARQHSHRTDSRPATRSGTFVIGGDIPVHRLGFGAMQLTGDGVWGEPANHSEAIAVLRRAVELGILEGQASGGEYCGLFFLGRYTSSKQSAESPAKSIAVLPFDNQNRDPDTDYLSDGIPESIINSLSQLPNLKVMSRNSVFHYKGKDMDAQAVAKELKVQAVLTGRMTQRGDGLSISVELINAQDNSQIWGQQYNRKLADVFAVQEEIAKEISEKLRLKLTGAERQQLAKRPTENLKAFQYYMQGWSQDLWGLEREGTGFDLAGTWLSNGNDRILL